MIFNKYSLFDLCDVQIGRTPPRNEHEWFNPYGGGIKWASIKDLGLCNKYLTNTSETISKEAQVKFNIPMVKADTLLLSFKLTIGRLAFASEDMITNEAIAQLPVKRPDLVDQDYLYYYLKKYPWEQLGNTSSIATAVNSKTIKGMQIALPPLNIQKKIASILDTIDKKIDTNTEINNNLAEQIQVIYSNEFDTGTHTPSGVLADICQYSSDRIPVSELSVSTYFSTENMQPNKAGSIDAASLPSIAQTTRCHKGDILISNIRPYFKKIVYVTNNGCGCSTDVLCFVPKEGCYSAYLFGTLYMDHFFDYMVAGSKGTKMPRGDKQQIMNYPVVIPSKDSLALFNGIVAPMLDQISSNRIENNRLAALRDTLLPKLISGELDVTDVDF